MPTTDFETVAGHAGQSRRWLVFDWEPESAIPEPWRVELEKRQVFHHFEADEPHPLDGVGLIVAQSAGDGFLRRMRRRNVEVLLTGERDPRRALERILAGEALPDPRFDVTLILCKVRDLFSKH
jgi:hypothetical protein